MKKIMALLVLLLVVFAVGCGESKKDRVYSGNVYVDHMDLSNSAALKATTGAMLMTGATTSLSDLATTITTTFQGGDISISGSTMAYIQGSIVNDTPNDVKGLWYCPGVISTATGTVAETTWGDTITIPAGETYTFNGGIGFTATATYQPIPGPMAWTLSFFDTTADPNAPTAADGMQAMLEYGSTHTPRAVGVMLFDVVP